MRIKFSEVDARTNDIWLATDDTQALKELSNMILPNVEYEITIKEAKQKRSLSANSYAWSLINELAKVQGITPIEVYKQQVQNMYTYDKDLIEIIKFESAKREWEDGHTGRLLEPMGVSEQHPDYIWVKRYKGTSSYDTKEMSHFIDLIIYECQQLGIKTEPKSNIDKLKASWGQ